MKTTLKFKSTILFACLILSSCYSFSQENFIPGYVINNSGDTLKGFVNYRNWAVNPKTVEFKETGSSDTKRYVPTDIKEFSVKYEIYVSGIVEVENTPMEETKLDYDSKLKISVDTIFLQTLFKGKKTLYYYMNNNGRENFYINKDNGFQLLISKKYLIRPKNDLKQQGTTSTIITRKDYIGQLYLFFSDCPALRSKIGNTSYAKKDLIRLFQNYSKCSSVEPVFQRKPERMNIQIGALAGVSLTKLKFKSMYVDYNYLEKTNYKLSPNVSGGMFFDLIMPRNLDKFSINNELLFSMYKTDGQYEFEEYDHSIHKLTTEFAYSYLKINNMLRYRFLLGNNISLFINAGISNGMRLSETQYLKKEITTTYSGTTVYEGSPLPKTSRIEQGFLVGAGIRSKSISFEARMERGDGMISVSSIDAKAIRYYFLIGYRFK